MALIGCAQQTCAGLSGGAALLTRLFVGGFFMNTGLVKIRHLSQFAANFAGWHLPYPQFSAALSAYTEFWGGLLTVVGLCTRLVAIPMIINMLVALLAVVLRFNVASFGDFLNTDEPLYALTYLWLMTTGGGWLSLDAWLQRALRRSRAFMA
jgi:putative oxidoreductase